MPWFPSTKSTIVPKTFQQKVSPLPNSRRIADHKSQHEINSSSLRKKNKTWIFWFPLRQPFRWKQNTNTQNPESCPAILIEEALPMTIALNQTLTKMKTSNIFRKRQEIRKNNHPQLSKELTQTDVLIQIQLHGLKTCWLFWFQWSIQGEPKRKKKACFFQSNIYFYLYIFVLLYFQALKVRGNVKKYKGF